MDCLPVIISLLPTGGSYISLVILVKCRSFERPGPLFRRKPLTGRLRPIRPEVVRPARTMDDGCLVFAVSPWDESGDPSNGLIDDSARLWDSTERTRSHGSRVPGEDALVESNRNVRTKDYQGLLKGVVLRDVHSSVFVLYGEAEGTIASRPPFHCLGLICAADPKLSFVPCACHVVLGLTILSFAGLGYDRRPNAATKGDTHPPSSLRTPLCLGRPSAHSNRYRPPLLLPPQGLRPTPIHQWSRQATADHR